MHRSKRKTSSNLKQIVTVWLMAALLIAPLKAGATTSAITNGSFETGADQDTSITGWTAVNNRIDLGVDSIAGCQTVDTSNYATLRDYAAEYANNVADGVPVPPSTDPSVNNDSLVLTISGTPSYVTKLIDGTTGEVQSGTNIGAEFQRSGVLLALVSDITADPGGFVVHGPAV